MEKNKKIRESLQTIGFFAALVFLWQALYVLGTQVFALWKPYALPSPAGVWAVFWRLTADGSLLRAAGSSLARGFLGYVLAVLLGMTMGLLMNQFGFLRRNMRPLIMGVQTLPSICWVPFSILWFGLTEQAILFVVVMGSVFGLAVATDHAIRNVPLLYKKAALSMGVDKKQLYWKIIFPAALPELIAGLKQGWSFAWRALMSGEVMTTCIGLGQTLSTGRSLADMNQVMLVMAVIILIGIVIDRIVFGAVERWVYRKRPAQQER